MACLPIDLFKMVVYPISMCILHGWTTLGGTGKEIGKGSWGDV